MVVNSKILIDILIRNASIITMDGQRSQLSNASIAINDGTIVDLAPSLEFEGRYKPRHEIDASRMLAIPGLINGHTHTFQTMCRGLGEGLDIAGWAQRAIWPVAPFFDESMCEVAAHLACLEMIESGTTTVVDSHYLHWNPNAQLGIAKAISASGMRAVLGRGSIDSGEVPEAFRETPEVAVQATERFIQDWNGKDNRIIVRPEALNEVQTSPEMVQKLSKLSQEAEVGFHMHAAESRLRTERLRKEVGFSTIDYLDHLGVLGPNVVLAHCVWLGEEEIRIIKESGTSVIHNPISNQFLADGVAPVPQFLAKGIEVGIGTDGAASNNSLDMFEVMKATALLHKVAHLRADLMDASVVFELATIRGAKALGIDNLTGSLESGKRADITLLNLDSPCMIPCYSVVSNLVYSASKEIVDTVIVEGRIIAENGKCISLNRTEVMNEARKLETYLKTKINI